MPMPSCLLSCLATAALLFAADPAAAQAARPKVGLVLGGGGARGAAHIGVLEVLERLRVPVDCVAGTSMGALVAGAWAAGLSPEQMRSELDKADWDDMFQDSSDYADLSLRNKRLAQRFLPGSETGLTPRGAVTPPGVVLGQKIKLFFNQLVRADRGEPQIEQLPLPVSIVATDIGTGERVVYRDGSLTQAMRASMSVPALLAPLEYRGRKLVDGGLVDNLPVREVLERCGAEVIIAVNVGSPPLPAESISGLLSVTAQMVALLTEQNVVQSLASLGPRDVLIKPGLDGVTAGDFGLHRLAAERGRVAAESVVQQLQALAVDQTAWAAWRQRVAVREAEVPRIDEVQVSGLLRVDDELLRGQIEQRGNAAFDLPTLMRDLGRAFGEGHYQSLDYAVQRIGGRQVLRVLPVEKSWGPDYLRLGLQLESNLSQGSSYLLRAGYQRTWLNRLGGELLVTGELGSSSGAAVEFYQPLEASQRWFADARAAYRRERVDYWSMERRLAEYRTVGERLDLTAGINLPQLGQLRAGWRKLRAQNELETGLDLFGGFPERNGDGALVALEMDRLDRLYFPRSGWAAQAQWFRSDEQDYQRLFTEVRAVTSVGQTVLAARGSWTGSLQGLLPLSEAGRLGGFLNMTAFAPGQLIGDDVAYLHARAERIIGRLPLGLRGDMRLGFALEAGRVAVPYAVQKRNGWLGSAALYLGGETPIGSVYIGVGRGSGGAFNAYLFIGTP
jgi:NTE family protein